MWRRANSLCATFFLGALWLRVGIGIFFPSEKNETGMPPTIGNGKIGYLEIPDGNVLGLYEEPD